MPSLKLAWSSSGLLAGFCCGVDKWTAAPGTAGTWMYHDHAMGNPMIGAEDKGLFGTLIVNPASGKVPALIDGKVVDVDIADIKREFILWMHETTFWGQELNHIVKGDKEIPLWTNPTVAILSHDRHGRHCARAPSARGKRPRTLQIGPPEDVIISRPGSCPRPSSMTDEPGKWFKDPKTGNSFVVVKPGDAVLIKMSAETNTDHTITSLAWQPGAANFPVDQDKPSNSSVTHTFEKPGLYVFTCKVHPYKFGAVIVDDPQTEGLDFGAEIQLITGAKIPTTSDIAKKLLRTFFVTTTPALWRDYRKPNWEVKLPELPINLGGPDPGHRRGLGRYSVRRGEWYHADRRLQPDHQAESKGRRNQHEQPPQYVERRGLQVHLSDRVV